MPIYDIVVFLLIGGCAGILSGMFGIGGGVIIVPSLVILTGMNLKEAYGTSLTALLPPVGIFGCLVYYRERLLDFKAAGAVALGVICTVGIGAHVVTLLEINSLKILYSVFLFYIGMKFIKPYRLYRVWRARHLGGEIDAIDSADGYDENTKVSYFQCFTIGLISGLVSGFFGIAGGAVIVPLLSLWLKLPTKRAIATSLGALLPPIGLPAVLVYHAAGNLNLDVAICVSIGLLMGTVFGAKLTIKLPVPLVRFAFGTVLLVACIKFSLSI